MTPISRLLCVRRQNKINRIKNLGKLNQSLLNDDLPLLSSSIPTMSNTQTKNIAPFAAISKDFLPYEESLEVSTQRRLKRSSSKSDSTSSIFFNLNISPDSHPDEEKGRKFKPSPSEPNIAVTFEKAADSTYSTLEGEDQDEDEDGMFDEWVVDRRQAEDTEEEMDGDDDDNLASTSFEAQPEDAEEVFWSHLSGAAVLEAAEVITLK